MEKNKEKEVIFPTQEIERFAVNKVENYFLNSNRLYGEFERGDKKGLIDGYIYVFDRSKDNVIKVKNSKNRSYKNEDFTRKIPVQIKGESTNKKSVASISRFNRRIKVKDLENYRKEGGIAYFVVKIPNLSNRKACLEEAKLFYTNLTGKEIEYILEKAKRENKKQVNIKLQSIPDEVEETERLFWDFYRALQIYKSYVQQGEKSQDELNKLVGCPNYEFCLLFTPKSENIKDISDDFLARPHTVYLKEISSGFILPFLSIPAGDRISMPCSIDLPTKEGKVCSYEAIRTSTHEETIYEFKGGLSLIFPKDNNSMNLKISLHGSLQDRIASLEIFLWLLSNEKNSLTQEEMGRDLCIKGEKDLEWHQDFLKAIEILNITEFIASIDFGDVSDSDRQTILTLASILENKIAIDLQVENHLLDFGLVKVELAIGNILFFFKKEKEGKFILHEFNNYNGLNPIPFSKYFLLISLPYINSPLININYSVLLKEIVSLPYNEEISDPQNELLLFLINQYDFFLSKNYLKYAQILLEVAESLSTHLFIQEKKEGNLIPLLNCMQIKKRNGSFSSQDREELKMALIDNSSVSEKIGAFILLDEKEKVSQYLEKYPEEAQAIKQTPIYRLFKP